MAWGWYTGAAQDGTQIDLGGTGFSGSVEELAGNSDPQNIVLIMAQTQGNVCNSGEAALIDTSTADREFIIINEWNN